MKFQNILLINLYYSESGYGEKLNFPPIGLAYISQLLTEYQVNHKVIDTGTGVNQNEILDLIKDYSPDLIGFSMNSIRASVSFDFIKNIKMLFPKIFMLVGGPHINTKRELILEKYPFVDLAVYGEGEFPTVKICNGEPFENIEGLIYRDKKGDIVSNKTIEYDINSLPFPKYDKFDIKLNYQSNAISILTSRGCPFLCAFCQQSSLLGKSWRGRTAASIIGEIEYWYGKGIKEIHILDDNFSFNKERVFQIATMLQEKGISDLNIVLVGGIRVRNTTQELLKTLKVLGVKYLSFGIESASNRILKMIKKGMTIEEADFIVKLSTEMGFKVRLFFIIGFPTETFEEVKKTFAFALKYPIYEARFFNLIPYENTGIMDWIIKNKIEMLYKYDDYMDNFKQFQKIPLFEDKEGMTITEKRHALSLAEDIIKQIHCKNLST